MNFEKENIFDIPVANEYLTDLAQIIIASIKQPGKKTFYGINAYNILSSYKNSKYKKALQDASLVYPEGIGAVIISMITGKRLKQKTTLMDFIYEILNYTEKNNLSIYILGGKPKTVEKAFKKIKSKFPNLRFSGNHHGYFKQYQEEYIVNEINTGQTDVLFVALGSPRQELWIDRNMKKINARAFFGIGGSIDQLAGVIPRAPRWMHENGLEWAFRLMVEPKRLWRRYLIGNLELFWIVVKERIQPRSSEKNI